MEKEKKNVSSGGISFLGALTLIFIVLKVIGSITWSWVWVLAPTWVPIALCVLILGIIA